MMQQQQPIDPVQAALEQQYAQPNLPVSEPFLSQIDNNIISRIIYTASEKTEDHRVKLDEKTNEPVIKHPDILNFIMPLSHLERTSNFSPDQSRSAWFKFKQEVRKAKARHSGDPQIINLLNQIQATRYTIIFGDAEKGRRQEYMAKMAGADRSVRLDRSFSDQRRPWWRR